MFKIYSRNCRF